jgi:hypothetical protein
MSGAKSLHLLKHRDREGNGSNPTRGTRWRRNRASGAYNSIITHNNRPKKQTSVLLHTSLSRSRQRERERDHWRHTHLSAELVLHTQLYPTESHVMLIRSQSACHSSLAFCSCVNKPFAECYYRFFQGSAYAFLCSYFIKASWSGRALDSKQIDEKLHDSILNELPFLNTSLTHKVIMLLNTVVFTENVENIILKRKTIYLSLRRYSPSNFGHLFSFLILYTVGSTPWAGDQSVKRLLPTHTTQTQNKRTVIHVSSGARNHDSTVLGGRRR